MSFRCNECHLNMNAGDVEDHFRSCYVLKQTNCKHPHDRRIVKSTTGFLCYEGCLDCNVWFGKPKLLPGGIHAECSCHLCQTCKKEPEQ